ncbi:MAG: flavodoxin domain-containing protein [Phycisphaerales bacterium]|nr:MAG: flavodoxin domain-containing protein [Phycisphaerales bacterium]
MESAIKVVDQVYWVGMNDRESPLFESIWPLPNGVSYNSYLMESIVRGLAQEGLRTVRVHNVSKSHSSFIISDIWRYRGLILGSPTYDAKLLPQAESLVSLLAEKMLRNRCVGVFGSFGWSGGAVKSLQEFVTRSGLQLVEPVIEARFAAKQEQLDKCVELGRNVASTVLRGTAD